MVNRYRIAALVAFISLIFIFALSSIVFATSRPISKSEYEIFTHAKQALEGHHYDTGIKLMRQHFQSHKQRHPFAYELYGHFLLLTNSPATAIEVYQQGVDEYPDHHNLMQNLAVAFSRDDQWYAAGQTYELAYELGGKNNSKLAFSAAVMYERSANYQLGILLLQELLQTNSPQPSWMLLLAQCYLQQNNNQEALDVLKQATQKFPLNEKVWRLLALCYQYMDKKAYALASYHVANVVNNSNALDGALLGTKYLNLGATNLASEWQNNEADGFQDQMIGQLCQNGNFNEALKRAMLLQSEFPTAARQFSIGKILQRMGQFEAAEKIYRELVEGGGVFHGKSLWALVILNWSASRWDKVDLLLHQLESVDISLYKRSAKLRNIIKKIVQAEQ